MDLNLDNYTNDELNNIFNISDNNLNISNAQKSLLDKITLINNTPNESLPEGKAALIEFYTKGMFKLLSIPLTNDVKIDGKLFDNYEQRESYTHVIDPQEPKEFISVKDKLLEPLEATPVVQTNNTFISRHVDHRPISTFNNNIKAGDINPLTRTTLKRALTTTHSTNFMIELPSAVKKVVSMKLIDADFPEVVYTVSEQLGSDSFYIDDTYVKIPAGSYSAEALVYEINKVLLALGLTVVLSYNDNNGLMTFDNGVVPFTLDFAYTHIDCPTLPSNIYKDQLTLGWILGFRGNYILPIASTQVKYFACTVEKNQRNIPFKYEGASQYTGESLFAPHGANYFLISINDYQNNHDNTFISPFQLQTVADNNILAKLLTKCCNKCCVDHPHRIYFGPTDIARLEIKIYDEFGRIIDINNADYSLTLELEVIYDL
jgi:hypothetical protein